MAVIKAKFGKERKHPQAGKKAKTVLLEQDLHSSIVKKVGEKGVEQFLIDSAKEKLDREK